MADRITIINNDNGTVDVNLNNEIVEQIPTTNLDPNIHAVQWYGDHGEVEYFDRNEKINDFSEFDVILTDRQKEIDRIHEQEIADTLANQPLKEEEVREDRRCRLKDTDWVVIKYMDIGQSAPQEWTDYRQALRDITEQSGFPENVNWPEKPTTEP